MLNRLGLTQAVALDSLHLRGGRGLITDPACFGLRVLPRTQDVGIRWEWTWECRGKMGIGLSFGGPVPFLLSRESGPVVRWLQPQSAAPWSRNPPRVRTALIVPTMPPGGTPYGCSGCRPLVRYRRAARTDKRKCAPSRQQLYETRVVALRVPRQHEKGRDHIVGNVCRLDPAIVTGAEIPMGAPIVPMFEEAPGSGHNDDGRDLVVPPVSHV